MTRNARTQTDWVRFAICVVVVVLVNVPRTRFFFRVDLTANRAYSISSASKDGGPL